MLKQNIAPFTLTQKQKQLLMRVILMMYLNQSVVQLNQTNKNLLKKVWTGLLIQLQITLLVFKSTTTQLVTVIRNTKRIERFIKELD